MSNGIGRIATFFLVLLSLTCVGLIGGAGYVKYQIDHATYNLASVQTADVRTNADSIDIQTQKDNEAKQAEQVRKKQAAQRTLNDWSLALTFVAWIALLCTAGMIIALYLVLQRRHSPALRALGQSITNLAQGDMQTPVWGLERHDAIGDLARAVDKARYRFSQLPDVTLMGEQGPLRMKFEGGARTLFEAMMQQLTTQTNRIAAEAAGLTSTTANQHKMLSELPVRLNNALDQLQKLDRTTSVTIQNAAQNLTSASGQLEKLVPFMQSRAQNMAEVTQIAGTQVATTLKNLVEAGHGLQEMTGKNAKTVEELSESTKELGERIFAALNLLQASSKVLSETTEGTQGRLKSLVDTLSVGEEKLSGIIERVEQRLESTAQVEASLTSLTERSEASSVRMDEVTKSMAEHQDQLNEQITKATQRLDEIIGSFGNAHQAMDGALENIKRDGDLLTSLFNDLKANNEQVLGKLTRTSETGHEVVQHLSECSQKLIEEIRASLSEQTTAAREQVEAMIQQNADLATRATHATDALSQTVGTMQSTEEKIHTVQDRFGEVLHDLGGSLERTVSDSFLRTEEMGRANIEKLTTLTTSVDQALQRLSVLSQLTSTLGTVATQMGQLLPTLGGIAPGPVAYNAQQIDVDGAITKITTDLSAHVEELLGKLSAAIPAHTSVTLDASQIDISSLTERLFADFEEKWKGSVNLIDSVRDDIATLIDRQKDQLEMRLVLLDKQIKSLASQNGDVTQAALLQEIGDALAAMNTHLAQSGIGDDLHGHTDTHPSLLGGGMSS